MSPPVENKLRKYYEALIEAERSRTPQEQSDVERVHAGLLRYIERMERGERLRLTVMWRRRNT